MWKINALTHARGATRLELTSTQMTRLSFRVPQEEDDNGMDKIRDFGARRSRV
jgi:hypothetical protein